ncbi:MAG: hemolysin family protein [Myxococcota bacterium]
MTLLIFFVFLAVGVSFLCSILEATLLSVTPSYMAKLEQEGRKYAPKLKHLKTRVDRPLAAILSLNTIANTMGAAGAGAQAQAIWNSEVLTMFSAGLTLVILIVSEIIPKTLGATYFRFLAPIATRILGVLMVLMFPFVRISEQITKVLGREGNPETEHQVNREEFAALAELGQRQGVFDESESRILGNLLRMAELRVRDIMTPRTVMFSLSEKTQVDEALKVPETMVFSRVPIYREQADNISGFVLKQDVLLRAARNEGAQNLGALIRELPVVPATLTVTRLFETLLDRREHIALVVDEYGGIEGLVTMEDVVETVLGAEIVDEADTVQDMREMARAKWYARVQHLGILAGSEEDVDTTAKSLKIESAPSTEGSRSIESTSLREGARTSREEARRKR